MMSVRITFCSVHNLFKRPLILSAVTGKIEIQMVIQFKGLRQRLESVNSLVSTAAEGVGVCAHLYLVQ